MTYQQFKFYDEIYHPQTGGWIQTLIFDWAYEEYLRGAFDPKLTMFRLYKEKKPTVFLRDRGRFPGDWISGTFAPLTNAPKRNLIERGYAVVSRKYRIVARTERNWVETLRANRCGLGKITADSADSFRRMFSKDVLQVGSVLGLPTSGHYLSDWDVKCAEASALEIANG